jgi:hypothetical protein
MAKGKKPEDADNVAPIEDAPEIVLGGDAPAESFEERTDEPRDAEAKRARLQEVGLIPRDEPNVAPRVDALDALDALDADPEAPAWHVEALCPTPVHPRSVVIRAENRQEAEAEYRRLTGLGGAIAGGIHVREATNEERETLE